MFTYALTHARTHPPTHPHMGFILPHRKSRATRKLRMIRKSRLAYSAKKQTTQTRALKSTGKFLQVKGKSK